MKRLSNLLFKPTLIVFLILSSIGFSFSPRFALTADAFADPSTLLTIDNFKNGETLYYDLPLLKGTAPGSQYVQITSGSVNLRYRVDDGRWRGFFPLQTGKNQLIIQTSIGPQFSFSLTFQPTNNSRMVRLAYPMGSDSSGSFDAPLGTDNHLDAALPRIKLAGRILQSMAAELLYEKGAPRRTFQLVTDTEGDPIVATPHVSYSVNQLRAMSGNDLWYYFYDQFGGVPNRNNLIDMAVMADTHFDPTTGTLQEHTALGGGRLGLFGDSTIYSFPETVNEVESHFTDSTQVETYLNPELGRAKEYWAAYTTSLGAMLHEMGHCFGLPHPDQPTPGDIMWRGFDYLNRLATTYEVDLGPIDPSVVTMPKWTDSDVVTLQANPWFSQASNQDGDGGPQLIPGRISSSIRQLVVLAEITHPKVINQPVKIDINWPSISWVAQTDSQGSLSLNLDKTQGNAGDTMIISFNTTAYSLGTYITNVTVTAEDSSIQNSPLVIPVKLIVVDHIWNNNLPMIVR
jgi:hypothetical protein